jgi:hypothetical protein
VDDSRPFSRSVVIVVSQRTGDVSCDNKTRRQSH